MGVRRQRVSGFMFGRTRRRPGAGLEQRAGPRHGSPAELAQTVARLRHGVTTPEEFRGRSSPREKRAGRSRNCSRQAGRVAEAFERGWTRCAPDVRVIVKPYVTHLSGSKTVLATANVTVDLLSTLYDGREVLVAGQTMLEAGDFYGWKVRWACRWWSDRAGSRGWCRSPLTDAEHAQLADVSRRLHRNVQTWMPRGRRGPLNPDRILMPMDSPEIPVTPLC